MAVNLISSEDISIQQTGSDIDLHLTGKTGDLVVDSIRTKNIASDTTLKNGLWSGTSSFSANAYGWYVVEEIKGGETYTISKKNNNSISGITLVIGTSAIYPASGVSVIDGFITNINDQKQYTLTTSSTAKYLFLGLFAGQTISETQKQQALEELQVEVGSAKTSYSPYQDLNPYQNIYSTNETRIGTWIDGKPLYRNIYTITNPASTNTDYYDLTSLNIKQMVHLYGYYTLTTGTFDIPFTDSNSNFSVMFYSSGKKLRGRFASDIASGITDAKVIIEYTKTTD